jgi:hypothetical protein
LRLATSRVLGCCPTILPFSGVVPSASEDHDRCNGGLGSAYLDDGVPVFTDDVASSDYPVFKGPATL